MPKANGQPLHIPRDPREGTAQDLLQAEAELEKREFVSADANWTTGRQRKRASFYQFSMQYASFCS